MVWSQNEMRPSHIGTIPEAPTASDHERTALRQTRWADPNGTTSASLECTRSNVLAAASFFVAPVR
jgi:hypothetical protein